MSKDESEIGGGKGRRLQVRAARGSKQAKPKRRSFTAKRRQAFLNHFAASCNAAAAARSVGISENCVYRWRRTNEQFREGWNEALAQGVAGLEADQVRAAREAVKVRRSKAAAVRVGTMDAKTSLAVLEAYRRSQGRDPGTINLQPYDPGAVRRRLEKKLRLLGLLDQGRQGPSSAADDPSTAARPPSSRDPGEDGSPDAAPE